MRRLNLQIERLKKLPRHPADTWQGGFVRLPGWITGEGPPPYRPVVALWTSKRTGMVHTGEPCRPEEADFSMVLKALTDFATNRSLAGYRPGKLEVNDSALAHDLTGMMTGAGIKVSYSAELEGLEEFVRSAAHEMLGREPLPGPLDGKGVTVERMRSFADAAAVFFKARLWDELTDEDLIQVESPKPMAAIRYAVVLGAGGHVHGLGFYGSIEDYWDQRTSTDPGSYFENKEGELWALTLEPITELPFADADLWEDHDLRVAGPEAYPCAMCHQGEGREVRPDAQTLSFLEGLLRALSETQEDELDSGRWSRKVRTFDGEVTFRLSLSFVLNPPDREELFERGLMPDRRAMEKGMAQLHSFLEDKAVEDLDELNRLIAQEFAGKTPEETAAKYPPRTALEKAQDLCYEAFDAFGRTKVILARKALDICPDCADAYVILGENARDAEKALEFYTQGIEAGKRALGQQVFEEEAGEFWGILKTRPFMRALFGKAQCQQNLGQKEEAVESYSQLLRLNPDDNQGVRYFLLPLLIGMDRDQDASKLMKQYRGDRQATLLYCEALLAFRRHGNKPESRRLLKKALKANKHVPEYILGKEEPFYSPESYSPGSVEEAIICADECTVVWQSTPGAAEWLAAQMKA